MRKDKFLLGLSITAAVVLMLDLLYAIFAVVWFALLSSFKVYANPMFGDLSIAMISVNAALLIEAGFYLFFRKN